jgi:hypothetical protein
MRILSFRATALGLCLLGAVGAPRTAAAQVPTTVHAACVGGAIGCTQLDFFIEFGGLTAPLSLDAFTLTLHDPGIVFLAPGVTEAEDALGFNFYNPSISADGLTLSGTFDFGAYLDPDITSTLRIRTEMANVPTGLADASALAYDYGLMAGGGEVAAGSINPMPVTATPEPGTIVLVASGFVGMGAWRRRRRANGVAG